MEKAMASQTFTVYDILKKHFKDKDARIIAGMLEQKEIVATKEEYLSIKEDLINLKDNVVSFKSEMKRDNLMIKVLLLMTMAVVIATNPKALEIIQKAFSFAK